MFGGRRGGRRGKPVIPDERPDDEDAAPASLEEVARAAEAEAEELRGKRKLWRSLRSTVRAPIRGERLLEPGQVERRQGTILRSLLSVPMASTIGLLTDEQWDRVDRALPLLHDKKQFRTKELRKACFNRGEERKGSRQMCIDRLHYSLNRQRRRQEAVDQERYEKWLYDSQAEGAVFAFGKNDRGQLGLGTLEPSGVPRAVQPLTGKQVSSVHAGFDSDVVFAVSVARQEVYVWGRLAGPTGLGDHAQAHVDQQLAQVMEDKREPKPTWERRREMLLRPVMVRPLCGEGVFSISVGRTHCLAQTVGGDLFGWGVDTRRQIGVELPRAPTLRKAAPEYAYIPLPTMLSDRRIPLDARVVTVAAGVSRSVALTEDGGFYEFSVDAERCEDPRATAPVPVHAVLANRFVSRVACGTLHVAVLTRDGDVYSWGSGDGGRLGHGDVLDREAPTLVQGLAEHAVQDVQASCFFSAALVCVPPLTNGGWVYTWGTGIHGQLGQGEAKISLEPRLVQDLAEQHAVVAKLCLGMYHCAALTIEHEVFTWGSNRDGCLGRQDTVAALHFTPVPGPVEGLYVGKKGVCVDVACGRDFTVLVTAPYTGKSDEELLAEYHEIMDAEVSFQRVRERHEAKARAKREAEAEKDRKARLFGIVVRFPGCAQCALDLSCPGFQPAALQPNICKHCQHERHRHTVEHSASDPRMTIELIKEMERKLNWRLPVQKQAKDPYGLPSAAAAASEVGSAVSAGSGSGANSGSIAGSAAPGSSALGSSAPGSSAAV